MLRSNTGQKAQKRLTNGSTSVTNDKPIVTVLCQGEKPKERLDIIIFGATGYVGRNTVIQAVRMLKECSWGVAGRTQEKLCATLTAASAKTGEDVTDVAIIIADVDDKCSLLEMTRSCKVLVNCCGPFALHGQAVISACVATRTHYVDLAIESHFTQLMQLEFHRTARSRQIYIVNGCGFEGLLMDLGTKFVQRNFKGTINFIEAFTEFTTKEKFVLTPIASRSAWTSVMLSCANLKLIPDLQERLQPKEMPDLEPKSSYRNALRKCELTQGVCLPFPVLDQQVVESSQYYAFAKNNQRPIQFHNYLVFPNFLLGLIFFIWCALLALLAQFEATRDLIKMFPRVFSLGFFGRHPDTKRMEKTYFHITLNAIGWPTETITADSSSPGTHPNKRMTVTISGENPLYGVACVCILTSALTILDESSAMPEGGGVYTPGTAFENTNFISKLSAQTGGAKFEIVYPSESK